MLPCSCLPFTLILWSPFIKVSSCSEFTAESRRKCLTTRLVTNLKKYPAGILGSETFIAKVTASTANPTGSGLFVSQQRPNWLPEQQVTSIPATKWPSPRAHLGLWNTGTTKNSFQRPTLLYLATLVTLGHNYFIQTAAQQSNSGE